MNLTKNIIINHRRFIFFNFYKSYSTSKVDSIHKVQDSQNRTELIEYKFNWGIGNKYTEHNKTRVGRNIPKNPKVVTISSDYFNIEDKFEHCKVVFDEVNEQWEVLWLEYNKLNGKPFPISKFGLQTSKSKSLEFANFINDKLKESSSTHTSDTDNAHNSNNIENSNAVTPEHTSTDPTPTPESLKDSNSDRNIIFDHVLQCWVGLGRRGNRPIARAFSADYHGYEKSKELSKNKL
ncbi:hypothetical protein TpMuguga_02g02350 [Theileria parva strain Muguga]|uniref:uncharacterized protein n=1 Tax=Theileria parva strain Muguga TaxID=333668 RepID=UPI001C621574|nr:uncharacterized protein TpMuguga_02g02350 [Theileria parva strain Muguga]KAF5153645.1 hypothetical protein TpMuguga_02g02350 [Theileria parva strain Muguga]